VRRLSGQFDALAAPALRDPVERDTEGQDGDRREDALPEQALLKPLRDVVAERARPDEAGVREVSSHPVEAADSFGATRLQTLLKVKIPLARDAIMLGVNQAIIMVLAVVVIGGLVGSGALGYEVAQGLQRNAFGQGVIASIAILALGIALDRVTQGRGAAGARSES